MDVHVTHLYTAADFCLNFGPAVLWNFRHAMDSGVVLVCDVSGLLVYSW